MPSIEEIETQVANLDGASKLLGRREIKELPSILWEDEQLERLIQGLYNNRNGILVATNKRLIFVDKGMMGGLSVEDFPYDKISSIQYKTGMMFGEVTIFASGNRAEIKQVQKDLAKSFADYVRARTASATPHASSPVSVPATSPNQAEQPSSTDLVDRLERLGELKAQGLLSEEEFQQAKQALLDK